ncbi:MAG: phosphoribosylanthranilate isomerase [Bacteroidota bacterium]|nr:phosphoribosylanthranilate isomerase [Bacteroidota bacterium]
MVKIKVCGMRNRENLDAVAALKPDFLGFIFYPRSPRYVVGKLTPDDLASLDPAIQKTGVFVNETAEKVAEIVRKYHLDLVQLHGDETPETCKILQQQGIRIIKAFRIDHTIRRERILPYVDCADWFLFDTATAGFGGSGKKFDWSLLADLTFGKPFFLSGGIGPDDAAILKKMITPVPYALDLNSKFETEPGYKNAKQLEDFIKIIRTEDYE